MAWIRRLKAFLAVLLTALLPTEQAKPFRLDEGPDLDQPHTHEEAREPEHDPNSEEQGVGTGVKADRSQFVLGGGTSQIQQCVNHNGGLLGLTSKLDGADFKIRLWEGFQSSFENGARFRITFHNVGAGVNLFLPAVVPLKAYSSENPKSPLQDATPLPSGPPGYRPGTLILLPSDAQGHVESDKKTTETNVSGLARVAIYKNTACAIYEVSNSEPSHLKGVIKKATIDVSVAFISNTGQNLPGLGVTTFAVAFAPPALGGSNRFNFEINRNAFVITACTQSLLFSFVTNRDGFDTTITISNTSLDPMGTSTQAGTVTLYYYGSSTGNQEAPKSQTSETVARLPGNS